jgi:putative hemolysin
MPNTYIDLAAQINRSNSVLLKKLPRFVVRGLERLIRQDEINRILNKYADVEGVDFLHKLKDELNIQIDYKGLENLPESGKCFFVANHPFGFVDGLILTHTVGTKYGTLKAIGNELFMLIPQLRPIIAAVNVFGANPKDYLRGLEQVYQSDSPITHFPAGLVSRMNKGRIEDGPWQKSFIAKAVSCQRDIVPFHFIGRNSTFFYTVYLVRKTLRIKANIELALFPHEIFNKRNKTIKVIIGKPIPYSTFDKSKTPADWAQVVKASLYSLS